MCRAFKVDFTHAAPFGWQMPGFDDSAWSAPAVADTLGSTFPRTDISYAGVDLPPIWGEPLWPTALEPNTSARMLIRMTVPVPAGNLIRTVFVEPRPPGVLYNATFMQMQHPLGFNEPFDSYVNGVNEVLGSDNADAIVAGTNNLVAIVYPWLSSFTPDPRPSGTWLAFMFQFAYLGARGRSYGQIVG